MSTELLINLEKCRVEALAQLYIGMLKYQDRVIECGPSLLYEDVYVVKLKPKISNYIFEIRLHEPVIGATNDQRTT